MNKKMLPDSKIFIAGHRGLVGSALMRELHDSGYRNIVTRTHAELDLGDQKAVKQFFEEEKPEYVFLAAAKAGGILANDTYRADFIYQNLVIQTNVIHQSWENDIKRLMFFGSSCIYPRECTQPIKEEYLLTGPLEITNRSYAIAKISGIEMCWAYNNQHNTKYLSVMPTNLYGKEDNYDLENSHVIPALIRKAHEAKMNNDKELVVWGTGNPRRDFLYSEDLAEACVFLMNLPDAKFDSIIAPDLVPLINIGSGEDITILELVELIKETVGFSGAIRLDTSKPDGTPQKILDINQLMGLGWQRKTSLRDGLAFAYDNYISKLPK